jgi:hypothetical protein
MELQMEFQRKASPLMIRNYVLEQAHIKDIVPENHCNPHETAGSG